MEFKTKSTGTLAALGALAVGGWLLADKVRFSSGTAPAVTVRKTYDVQLPVAPTLAAAAVIAGAALFAPRLVRRFRGAGASSFVEQAIDLNVPVSTAYNQWTQFEEFPRFMEHVEEVRQLDDTHLRWRATFAGKAKEWESEITEQIPDQRIAWRSTGGVKNAGIVTFDKIGENRTRVKLRLDYEPQTPGERFGSAVGAVEHAAKGNLKRFKALVERRGAETGAWRGTVQQH